ncbi:mechanosensitive ion channel family protein [Desulfopila sp. IMCC35006]|nr:mechanosensitive ion channel family protein [Desulfopila sp. IMCC35006]TKB28033.1 mechanosensitive ion channel family protein [Desulfopila sp. IMCC35006]
MDEVINVLKEIGAELQSNPEYGQVILAPIEVLGVDSFADSAVIIKARIGTVASKQWWVGREFNRLMKNKFDQLDIEIPFPHQTIYFGVDKKDNAPSAHVSVQS